MPERNPDNGDGHKRAAAQYGGFITTLDTFLDADRSAVSDDLQDIVVPAASGVLTADQAFHGHHIPPQQQILLYSDSEWEGFVQEWAHYCLKTLYAQVQRFAGSGDRGIDIAGFTDADKLLGVWDNYQCKHYDHALYPSDAWPEIGKLLWYTFNQQFAVPRRYYFIAPRGVGTSLNGYLSNAPELKKALIEGWDKNCKTKITTTKEIPLVGRFLAYVESFDFTIFDAKTPLQLVEDHKLCPCHVARFGGGLPARPEPGDPPGPQLMKRPRSTHKQTKRERHAALATTSGAGLSGINPSLFSVICCAAPQM